MLSPLSAMEEPDEETITESIWDEHVNLFELACYKKNWIAFNFKIVAAKIYI